jgi:hypothetical protein
MLDDRDPVFQEQLAFLETPEKQVVSSRWRYGDLGDDGIEIPVLGGEDSQPRGEAAIVGAGRVLSFMSDRTPKGNGCRLD